MKIFKKNILFFFLILLSFSFVGCRDVRASKLNTITIGMDLDNIPFGTKNDNGKSVGFDVDFANVLARELDAKIEIKDTPRIGLIPDLLSGKLDLIISGMSVEEATKISSALAFSDSYYKKNDKILVHEFNQTLKTIKDLHEKNVGVQINTAEHEALKVLSKKGININIVEYNSLSDAILNLQNGKLDAVASNNWYALSRDFEDIKFLKEPLTSSDIIVVGANQNNELITEINAIISNFKQTDEYQQLLTRWFNLKD